MATILKLGSLLLDGVLMRPGSQYQPGQNISFSDGNIISWIAVNGLLIADRLLLRNISWDDLNQQGFVLGKTTAINGANFLCRLLKVGSEKGVPNEWDSALDVTSEDNDLWHWKQVAFWGQEILPRSSRAYRGAGSARKWYSHGSELRSIFVGFRPALKLLRSERLASGSKICALGGQTVIYGTLLETTAYDAIIRPDPTSLIADADIGTLYAKLDNGTLTIDRTQMVMQTIKGN